MGLFSKDQDAVAEHQAAKDELERVARRDGAETEDYHRANERVAESEKDVSWFRR